MNCNDKIHIECCGFPRGSIKRDIDMSNFRLIYKCNKCSMDNNINNNNEALLKMLSLVEKNDENLNKVLCLINKQSLDLNNTVSAVDDDAEKIRILDEKIDIINAKLQRIDSKVEAWTNTWTDIRDNQSSQSQHQSSSTKLENMIFDLERKLISTSSVEDNRISKIDKGLSSLTSTLLKIFENLEATRGGLLAQHTVINSLVPSIVVK